MFYFYYFYFFNIACLVRTVCAGPGCPPAATVTRTCPMRTLSARQVSAVWAASARSNRVNSRSFYVLTVHITIFFTFVLIILFSSLLKHDFAKKLEHFVKLS